MHTNITATVQMQEKQAQTCMYDINIRLWNTPRMMLILSHCTTYKLVVCCLLPSYPTRVWH